MAISDLAARFDPILEDIATRSQVTDSFLDRDLYRLYVATLWTNVVLDPHDAGVSPDDLEGAGIAPGMITSGQVHISATAPVDSYQ